MQRTKKSKNLIFIKKNNVNPLKKKNFQKTRKYFEIKKKHENKLLSFKDGKICLKK